MRKLSRTMPKTKTLSVGVSVLLLAIVSATLSVIGYFTLPFGYFLIGLAVITLFGNIVGNVHLARYSAERRGETILTFAHDCNWRLVDTWVIRAVYEELQPYCRHIGGTMPLRASDRLLEDLGIDHAELWDVAKDIAFRTGRSLKDHDKNPYSERINTVKEFVLFFNHQPRTEAA